MAFGNVLGQSGTALPYINGNYDAGNHNIKNVADPVDETDAVNVRSLNSQLTSILSSYATQSWVTSLLRGSPIIETGSFQGGGYSESSPLQIQFSFTPVFWFIYSRTGAKSGFNAMWETFLGFPWGVGDTLAIPRVRYDTKNNRVSLWGPNRYAFDTNYYWYYCGVGIKS